MIPKNNLWVISVTTVQIVIVIATVIATVIAIALATVNGI
jgi:hypothetical protein